MIDCRSCQIFLLTETELELYTNSEPHIFSLGPRRGSGEREVFWEREDRDEVPDQQNRGRGLKMGEDLDLDQLYWKL